MVNPMQCIFFVIFDFILQQIDGNILGPKIIGDTTGISSKVLEDILNLTVTKKHKGKLESGEIGIPMENSSLVLPCGIYGRWENNTK